jgi:hypothetical protein
LANSAPGLTANRILNRPWRLKHDSPL